MGSIRRDGRYADNDTDGLIDTHELSIGTNQTAADTDGDGAPDGAEISVLSNPLDPLDRPAPHLPVAKFSWSPAVPVPGLPVQFTDASYDIGGIVASRSWDFGDNTTSSNDRHPVYAFSSVGTFTITLTVTDNDGSNGTLAQGITVAVDAQPTPNFSMNATNIDAGQSIAFTFNGSLGNIPITFQWNFGDGTPNSTARDPLHRYVSAGNFTVCVEVTDLDGDVACCHRIACIHVNDAYPVANFTTSSIIVRINTQTYFTYTGTDGNSPLSFQWTFGDNTANITIRNPSHKYTTVGNYTVTLTVTDVDGDKSTMRRVNYIQASADLVPVANFVANATSIVPGAWVGFTFTGSEGDAPATLSWNFGDGGTSSARNPAYRYITSGNFTVMLTVVDNDGDARSSTMIVHVAAPYMPPVASFHSNATTGMGVGTAVAFTFDGSCGSGTPSFHWNFGDGASSTSRDPVHVYWSLGTFDVNVTVIDGTGRLDTAVRPGHIIIVDLSPLAIFVASTTTIVTGNWVTFTFIGTRGDAPTTFQWSFGDGSTNATVQNPVHQYATMGTFVVRLVVTDADGDASTASIAVIVLPVDLRPIASFHSNATTGMGIGTLVAFAFDGFGGDGTPTFLWNFGDGITTALQDPIHQYNLPGNLTVQLIVIDADGDTDVAMAANHVIIIDYIPVANLTTNATSIVQGNWIAFTFTGITGDDPATLSWDFGDGSQFAAGFNPTHLYNSIGTFVVILQVIDADRDTSVMQLLINVTSGQAPLLTEIRVSPVTESNATTFIFTIRYIDVDNIQSNYVYVIIDGQLHSMDKIDPNDDDYTDGCEFFFQCSLSAGWHEYYFNCSNGLLSTNSETNRFNVQQEIVQSSSPITTQNVIILIMIAIVATVAAIAIPRHIKIKKSLNNTNLSAQNVYNSSPGIVITPPRQELPSISEDKPTRPSNISSGKLLHVTRNDLHVILQKPNTTKTHRIYSCQDCGVTIIVDEPTNEISYYCRKCNKLMVIILKCPYCANSITIPQTSQLESDAADILCPVCKERFLSASIPKI